MLPTPTPTRATRHSGAELGPDLDGTSPPAAMGPFAPPANLLALPPPADDDDIRFSDIVEEIKQEKQTRLPTRKAVDWWDELEKKLQGAKITLADGHKARVLRVEFDKSAKFPAGAAASAKVSMVMEQRDGVYESEFNRARTYSGRRVTGPSVAWALLV